MEISLELVPRSELYIKYMVDFVEQNIPQISAINFPDLLRFEIRAWDACRMISDSKLDKIAHIRAIDFDMKSDFQLSDFLKTNDIKKVLVIEGDKPEDMPDAVYYPTTSIDLIDKIKSKSDNISVYAAFDPYRNNIRYELEYLQQKKNAGASGFFSQPFFDLRLLEIYSEYLQDEEVYWGVSPVITKSSQQYWETRNRAIFPKSFVPTLDWNVKFARRVMNFCQKNNYNFYLMPINIDLEAYLLKLFR